MATAYGTIAEAEATATSVTIAKPSSLAEGDFMIASVMAYGSTSASSVSAPDASWSSLEDVTSAGKLVLYTFSKWADADDVAATDFTFTATTSGTTYMSGNISRYTDVGAISGIASGSTGSTTPYSFSGFTPIRADSLFVIVSAVVATGASTLSYGIATDNPTWTERADNYYDVNPDIGLALATGPRPETTATGDVTLSTSSAADAKAAIMIGLSPVINGSVADGGGTLYTVTPATIFDADFVVEGTDPTVASRNVRQWTSPTKSDPSWTEPTL